MTGTVLCRAQALYPFHSNQPSSLQFEQDEYVDVLNKSDSGWWLGSTHKHRAPGWFPKDYVSIISEQTVENGDGQRIGHLNMDTREGSIATHSTLKQSSSEWTVQMTEDGADCYLFNPVTGEMKLAEPNDVSDDQESELDDMETYHRRSWLEEECGLNNHDHEARGDEEDEEEVPFIPEKIPAKWAYYILPWSNTQYNREPVLELWGGSEHHQGQWAPPSTSPTWEELCGCVAITAHNLNLAVRFSRDHLYIPYTHALINAIRLMLLTTIDPLLLNRNEAIRVHHRVIISSLSRLILSVTGYQLCSTSDIGEIQIAVRDYVAACQAIPIAPRPVDRVLANDIPNILQGITTAAEQDDGVNSDNNSNNPVLNHRHSSAGSAMTHFTNNTMSTLSTKATSVSDRHSLGTDRDLSVIACARCLLELLDSMLSQTTLKERKLLPRAVLASVLLHRLDHICQKAGKLFYAAERIALDITSRKHILIQGFGVLFCKLQMLTGEEASLESTLNDIRKTIVIIRTCIQNIYDVFEEEEERQQSIHPMPSLAIEPSKQDDDTSTLGSPTVLASITDDKQWYMRHDYDPKDIVFTAEGQVKGATLTALVERLTLHDQIDMTFNSTFLLTYRSFCTSEDLLRLLEARFNLPAPQGLSSEELLEWREKKQKLIRLRVFNVLKIWLEQYFNEEEDNVILGQLETFTETCIRGVISIEPLKRLIQKRQSADPDIKRRTVSSLPAPPEPLMPRNPRKFRLLDIHPLELARQLTTLDFQIYGAIRPAECLSKTGAVLKCIEYSNQLTLWVTDSILCQDDLRKRTSVVKYWVQVAEKCRYLQNFNTCMTIMSAFDNSAIGRLKRTWEAIGTRAQNTLADLRKVLGANRNFVEYRTLVHSVNPPCIPFVGIYLQDLTFIEDGNSDLLKTRPLINFSKRAKIGDVIREIQQYQSIPYNFSPVPVIQMFIKANMQASRDEEALYNESLKIEPREDTEEAVARVLLESGFF